jgi:predicted deacylase
MTGPGSPPHGRPGQLPLPAFKVDLAAPDLTAWLAGNTGIPGFTSYTAAAPGPHVVLLALVHGNEIAGAIVLDRLLRGGLRPERGRLTFGFANIAAFQRFDAAQPTMSRFIDEDLNRVWDLTQLDGPRRTRELDRAREIRPLIDTADIVLDLHSMLWPAEPLILCGATSRGRDLARAIGTPAVSVADHGHLAGRRLIDYPRFAEPAEPTSPAAVLVEAGQHWARATVEISLASVAGVLRHCGMITAHPLLPEPRSTPTRHAEVTAAVTAATTAFSFMRGYHGGEVIPRRNTIIALDGETEIRTPYDNCLLVMPNLRPSRGHTTVRLARFVE